MLEMEKNQLGTLGVLRATSGNTGKRLKMRVGNNQSCKIGGGGYQPNSHPETPCGEGKNARMDTGCYARSYA